MYHLLIVTGMRRGEAVGLRWSDIDLLDRSAVVVQQITEVRGRSIVSTPKTKRSARVLALDDDIVQALRRHREAQLVERRTWGSDVSPDDLVFAREDGRPLRPEYATRHFQALARAAGLPEIRLHDLRHTSASLALAAGIDTKVVSERLGHATIAITANLYTHVIPRLEREAADKLGKALKMPPREAAAYEMPTTGFEQVLDGGAADARSPPTKKAPGSVSAG
jgi:integrase